MPRHRGGGLSRRRRACHRLLLGLLRTCELSAGLRSRRGLPHESGPGLSSRYEHRHRHERRLLSDVPLRPRRHSVRPGQGGSLFVGRADLRWQYVTRGRRADTGLLSRLRVPLQRRDHHGGDSRVWVHTAELRPGRGPEVRRHRSVRRALHLSAGELALRVQLRLPCRRAVHRDLLHLGLPGQPGRGFVLVPGRSPRLRLRCCRQLHRADL